MSSPPPLFKQEAEDSCAIACLRSILAKYGISTDEKTLEPLANKQPGGVYIADLANAAESFGLHADVAQLGPSSPVLRRVPARLGFAYPDASS